MSAVPITYDMDLFRGVKHRYYDSDSSHYAGIKANGTTTSSVDYTLPPAPPAANDYVLACSTAGVMNWTGSNTPANPGASVGLSAVNGTATTYMRSDAAPALSQAIAPTWTGNHNFDGGLIIRSTTIYSGPPATTIAGSLKYNSGGSFRTLAYLQIGKENDTDGNDAGYFAIYTRPYGGSTTEWFRISSAGLITIGSRITGLSQATGATDAVAGGRTITSGSGLTGGGDLTSDRTLAVGAGTGITVNADDVAVNQAFSPDWTGFHSHRFDSMGTTPDDAKGILLYNTTAAAAGAQQISPAIRWRGQGWKTNSTAASQQVAFRAWVLPAQGSANPYGIWKLQASINEGSYSDVMTVSSAGLASVTTLTVSSTFNVIGAVGAVGLAYTDIAGNLQGLGWARGTIAVGGVANWETLSIGSARQVLTSDGTDASWATPLGADAGSGTGTCTTTNETTATTLYSFTPTDGTSVAVVAHIGNKKDDESASEAFIYLATVRRSGGTVSVDYTTAASIGGGFSVLREFNVSGTTVRIQVKGAAGTTIQWKATVFCTVIS